MADKYAVSRVVVRNGFLTGMSPAEPPLSKDYADMWGLDSKGHLQSELSWPWKFQLTSNASYQGPVLLEDVVAYVSCSRLLALLSFTCNAQAFTRVDGRRAYLSVGRREVAVLRISDSAPDLGCASTSTTRPSSAALHARGPRYCSQRVTLQGQAHTGAERHVQLDTCPNLCRGLLPPLQPSRQANGTAITVGTFTSALRNGTSMRNVLITCSPFDPDYPTAFGPGAITPCVTATASSAIELQALLLLHHATQSANPPAHLHITLLANITLGSTPAAPLPNGTIPTNPVQPYDAWSDSIVPTLWRQNFTTHIAGDCRMGAPSNTALDFGGRPNLVYLKAGVLRLSCLELSNLPTNTLDAMPRGLLGTPLYAVRMDEPPGCVGAGAPPLGR